MQPYIHHRVWYWSGGWANGEWKRAAGFRYREGAEQCLADITRGGRAAEIISDSDDPPIYPPEWCVAAAARSRIACLLT